MAIFENAFGLKCVIQNSGSVLERPDLGYQNDSSMQDSIYSAAMLYWNNNCWVVFNNGKHAIWVAGKPVPAGKESVLETGIDIFLAQQWYCKWTVIDLSPPSETSVFLAEDGYWYSKSAQKSVLLKDGDLVCAAKRKWCLCCAKQTYIEQPAATAEPDCSEKTTLIFKVSLDEEHVFSLIETDQQVINLKERVHHYLLVTLARIKLEDHRRGYDASSCGWVCMDDLCKMMGTDASHINIQIYRARKQIAECLYKEEDLPMLIERRSGCLRFGDWSFKIIRGSSLEGNMILT